jgi:hypothetical protein
MLLRMSYWVTLEFTNSRYLYNSRYVAAVCKSRRCSSKICMHSKHLVHSTFQLSYLCWAFALSVSIEELIKLWSTCTANCDTQCTYRLTDEQRASQALMIASCVSWQLECFWRLVSCQSLPVSGAHATVRHTFVCISVFNALSHFKHSTKTMIYSCNSEQCCAYASLQCSECAYKHRR